jgi:hypothetical protein
MPKSQVLVISQSLLDIIKFQERRREEERKRREEKEARRLAAEAKAKEVVITIFNVMLDRLNMHCRKSVACVLKLVKLNASRKKLIAGKWNRRELSFVRGG